MGRSPCCSKEGMNRGAWTAVEDQILRDHIKEHGEGKWRNIPKFSGLKRCGKSCRLRWLNYLRPDIKRGNITPEEEDLILRLHKLLGNRWSLIAGRIPGRTDNEIKNYWNTTLSKKVPGEESKIGTKKSKKKQPIKTLTPDEAHSSPIVGTRATRYDAPSHAQPKKPECSTDEKPAEQRSSLDPASGNDLAMVSKSSDESPLALSEEDDFNDLPMDFSLSELLLGDDIAETEFWKLCQFENGAEEGVDGWMEESLKNWMPTDGSFNYGT